LISRKGSLLQRGCWPLNISVGISLLRAAAIFYTGILFERAVNPCVYQLQTVVEKTHKDEHVVDNLHSNFRPPSAALASSGPSEIRVMEWENWPAIAYEQVGAALVTKGDSFFNRARELYFQQREQSNNNDNTQQHHQTLMDEFIEVYKNRPDLTNLCGIRINHALALLHYSLP